MMRVNRVENTRKWGIALIITIGLLVVSLIMTVVAVSFSEWLPLVFCWGDILFTSAIVIILLGLVTGGPFPSTERWWEGAGWGLLTGGTTFALFAFAPNCCDTADHMRNLGCFGTMAALFAFAIGAAMRRYSVLLVAGASFYFWIILFPDDVSALIFTVASLGVAGVFLYWLSQTYPIVKEEPEYPDPGDIFNDPEFIKALKEGKSWPELSTDPDHAMVQLERMAQAELPLTADEDELPEWLMEYDVPQEEMIPEDNVQKKNFLDKSSPAFLWIFALLLILFLFMLTILALFVR